MKYKIGEKVRCIKDCEGKIEPGRVLTIRSIVKEDGCVGTAFFVEESNLDGGLDDGLFLDEIEPIEDSVALEAIKILEERGYKIIKE